MRTIPLGGKKAAGRVALIDDEDYELVALHAWSLLASRKGGPYAKTNVRNAAGQRATIYMHTMITGWPLTDHRNHDGLDNQRANLRPATQAQNNANQRAREGLTSRYKGTYWHRGGRKWAAQIQIDGTNHHLGLFSGEDDAARAYDAAALAAWGEFAHLNFPQ